MEKMEKVKKERENRKMTYGDCKELDAQISCRHRPYSSRDLKYVRHPCDPDARRRPVTVSFNFQGSLIVITVSSVGEGLVSCT